MPGFFGWLLGVALGAIFGPALASAILTAAGTSLVVAAIPIVGPIAAFLGAGPIVWPSLSVIALLYVLGYMLATTAVTPLIAGTPLAAGAPSPLPADPTEEFARCFMFGLNASLNSVILLALSLLLPPGLGSLLAGWAFLLISMACIPAIATDRIFQGFLGWSAWTFPMSHFATVIGLALFVINAPFALASLGPGALRFDFTTGVVESTGGLVGVTGFVNGGFSLGNFTFLSPLAGVGTGIQSSFIAPGVSSHETGHSLNTAAFGGIFLWINAVDQNLPPFLRGQDAYGELTADSHFPNNASRQVRLWT